MPIVSDVTQADVVVVGGGITGLATAYEVQKAGRSVVVLEASDYVGGRIMTRERNGDMVASVNVV
jgi:monoamine oxidase